MVNMNRVINRMARGEPLPVAFHKQQQQERDEARGPPMVVSKRDLSEESMQQLTMLCGHQQANGLIFFNRRGSIQIRPQNETWRSMQIVGTYPRDLVRLLRDAEMRKPIYVEVNGKRQPDPGRRYLRP